MGNIVLMRFVILLYIVVCIVFCLSPYMSGRGKRFGIKVDKKSKYTVAFCVLYIVTSVVSSVVFAILCMHKNSFVFVNVSVFMYIIFMSLIYFKIRQKLKILYSKDIFQEIIINNPPEYYTLKMINPLFYTLYFIPVAVNFFIGRDDLLFVQLTVIQFLIVILSFLFNVLICKFKNYVDDNIDESVKRNIKYRKIWNVNTFISLLAVSISITVMYAEYKKIIYIGGMGGWIPIAVVAISVGILVFYSFKHYKK